MTKRPGDTLYSYRCNCGKLLFKGLLADSTIQIKCKKCGDLMSFQGQKDHVSPDGNHALMFNSDGRVISASSNIQELLGYSLEELLLKEYSDLLASAPHRLIETNIRRFWSLPSKERYFFKSKVSLKRSDGRFIAGNMQSKFTTTPNGTVLFSVFRSGTESITSRVAPEFFALREYPFFLQIDLDGICLDASGARNRPYSREKNEIIGKLFVSFMCGDEIANQEELMRHLRAGKMFELLQKEYTRTNGTSVYMDASFMPNFDSDGSCVDYTVYVFNETILEHHERQFVLGGSV